MKDFNLKTRATEERQMLTWKDWLYVGLAYLAVMALGADFILGLTN